MYRHIRKTRFALVLWFVLLVFPFVTVWGQVSRNIDEKRVNEIFSEWDRHGSPGCAVAVYHDGEVVFKGGYGEAILEDNIPITPQTVFYAGSISKQFTAAAVALLSLRGELDLNRPVRDYIPEIPEYAEGHSPTVRQLVHHTSGLPDLYSLLRMYGIRLQDGVPVDKLADIIINQSHLNFEPGSEYLYSNSGYTLLAELVERVSGQTFREYTEEHLFEPLGMYNTHFHDDHSHAIDNKALSYQPANSKSFRLSYLDNFEGVGPGGLYTTVGDMLKWDQQLYENRLPDAEGFYELMHRQGVLNNGDTLSYAFGLKIDEYKGQKTVGHSGTFMGFKADYLRLPEYRYGSVILCNAGNINPSRLNRKLAEVFMKDTFEEWLSRHRGTYYSASLDLEYTLQLKDGNLYLDRVTSPQGILKYDGGRAFSAGGWEFEFETSEQGEVKGFILSSGRAKNIFFQKRS